MTIDERLAQATDRHRAGELSEARRLYQLILADEPAHGLTLFRAGVLELQEGHAGPAIARFEQAVAAEPAESQYHFGLGEAFAAARRWPDAVDAYRRASQLAPSAQISFALGVALQSSNDHRGAIQAYEAAVALRADFADAFNNLGNCRQLLSDFPRAEAAYRQALNAQPEYAGAMANLGALLQETGRAGEGAALLRAAVEREPHVASHGVNLGAALCRQGDFAAAEVVLRRVLETDADNADATYNLGNALQGLGRSHEAIDEYRKAIALRPDYADALNNLGNLYKLIGEFKAAGAAYDAAIRVRPNFVVAQNNAACLLRTLGRLDDAEARLRHALAVEPRHAVLHDNLGSVLKDAGDLSGAIECYRNAVALDPTNAAAEGNLVYALSFEGDDPAVVLEASRQWNDRHAAGLLPKPLAHDLDRTPGRRLRIGYVSPDFREHCQALFTVPLFTHHDHEAFEIVCYSSVERPDAYTRQLAACADVWRDVRPLGDAALAGVIRADRIDVLVDLTMHMANGRPLLFARKPAPVQVAWLAYPGTTGLDAMDYRLSDPRLDPPGFEAHYAEQTVHLPDAFWCYNPLTATPEVNPLPAISRGQLTLGCLNSPGKLTDRTLRLWSGVLQALPDARLLLMAPPTRHRERLLERFALHGVASKRIEFVPYRPRAEYLRTYHEIDLSLDTLPYNGHTTSLDSLWMGVPVVTRVGSTCVGRGGLSQLHQLDLLDLAAETDEAFVATTTALAADLPRLAALRLQLRPRMESSPLMDGRRFARNIEAAYRQMRPADRNAIRTDERLNPR